MAEEFCAPSTTAVLQSPAMAVPLAPPKVSFLRADVDICPEAAKDYGVEVLPTILIFQNEEVRFNSLEQNILNA